MSSIIANMSIADLLEQRTLIDTQICIKTGGATAGLTNIKLTKSGKPKKESTRKGKPTCNGDFTKKICAEHKEAIEEFKKANPDQKGAHLVFLSAYKKEHKEEYDAFEAAWKEANPKVEDHGSVSDASGDAKPESDKPKRVISPEQIAKMQAGRVAAKAKKEAEKAGTSVPVASVTSNTFTATTVVVAPSAAPSAAPAPAKKAVKKVQPKKKDIVEPVAVISSANSTTSGDDEPELIPFKHGGSTYMRLGNKREDGSYLWATGDLWTNNKGARGAYVGAIQDDGSIDADAMEPILE